MADAHLQDAYRSSTLRLYTHHLQAKSEGPGFERLRERAHELKREVINHLDEYLEWFASNVERHRGHGPLGAHRRGSLRHGSRNRTKGGAREVVKVKTM